MELFDQFENMAFSHSPNWFEPAWLSSKTKSLEFRSMMKVFTLVCITLWFNYRKHPKPLHNRKHRNYPTFEH